MAYFDEKIQQAYILSNNALKGQKWDTEAFLVGAMVRLLEKDKVDLVPESNIDEITDISKDAFVVYMNNRTLNNLDTYLSYIKQIISELYNSEDGEKKEHIALFIDSLHNII